MKFNNTAWTFVTAITVVPLLCFLGVSWYEANYKRLPVYGESGHKVSEFALTNQFGDTITDRAWNNKIVVVDFFFTHCPVICPKMTKNLQTVSNAFSSDNQVVISSFTVDPERDTSHQLLHYADLFHINNNNWYFLTGDKRDIYKLARKGFLVDATDGDGGPADFIHSDRLVLLDSKKRIRAYYDGTAAADIDLLIKDIKRLKHEREFD